MHHAISGIRFIHNAIKSAVLEIEPAAERVSSTELAATLAGCVEALAREVHLHTSGEEAGIYSLLDERATNVGVHYLFDHVEEEALFKAVVVLLKDWSPSPTLAAELRRATASL